jgi:hypothetical protein
MRTTLPSLGPKVSLAAPPLKPATLKGSGASFSRALGVPSRGAPKATGAAPEAPPEAEGSTEADPVPGERPPRPRRQAEPQDDPLDPATRQAAHLAPPPMTPAPAEAPPTAGTRASVEDLLPALVRKVAWSGDGRRGTVRLELGSGAEVVVASDEGRVTVHLRAPPGVDLDGWRTRLGARLAARGLDVLEID